MTGFFSSFSFLRFEFEIHEEQRHLDICHYSLPSRAGTRQSVVWFRPGDICGLHGGRKPGLQSVPAMLVFWLIHFGKRFKRAEMIYQCGSTWEQEKWTFYLILCVCLRVNDGELPLLLLCARPCLGEGEWPMIALQDAAMQLILVHPHPWCKALLLCWRLANVMHQVLLYTRTCTSDRSSGLCQSG
ncbi:hypothetical protein HDV57DRAFT_310087 [Trichoderma longibrachiatum]|uniref:Uncharacterized protein n=1 Tax=Trichoderma longibrachiatum ATCC 18648 TaxID=983965 RepID=A0A2T4CC03_TRILO|nr:hypothetical protein M440DRAFT_227236 [Trichoderma longibrachiatum ATCC 18648]